MPQIVVVVIRTRASGGPTSGIGFSSEHDPAGLDEDGGAHSGHGRLLEFPSIRHARMALG